MRILTKILYKVISLIDTISISDTPNKVIKEFDVSDVEIKTDTGFKQVSKIYLTKPFEQYTIFLENNYNITCADNHILFNHNMNEVYCKELKINDYIQTDQGLLRIVNIIYNSDKLCMCDITVNDNNHRFYANGILSHNSVTTAIFGLWKILFNTDKNGLILSKSGPAGRDLLSKIKDMYMYLPYHLKPGVMKWNQSEISFDNNSILTTEAFGPTAGLGSTRNLLILDEAAWTPGGEADWDLFYQNVIPTVTTLSDSNVAIISTQNGRNHFYKLWNDAVTGKSGYATMNVDWWQVPQWNVETRQWEKRTEKWKQEMVGILGSEEKFYYQYGTAFLASNNCLVSKEKMSRIHEHEVLFNKSEEQLFSHSEYLYIKPGYSIDKSKFYIILIDLAEGNGGDGDDTIFNIIEIQDTKKFEQVAYWKSNEFGLEESAFILWQMYNVLFNSERCIISIEWNTYGALFYNYIKNLNEPELYPEWSYRFNIGEEVWTGNIINYKKGSQDEEIIGLNNHKLKTVPGIRWSASNKKMACALLKMMLENDEITMTDIITISQLENFEDKNGTGSYKASYGHDDLIMTFCQIPMLINTGKFKEFIEDFEMSKVESKLNNTGINFYSQSQNPFANSNFNYLSQSNMY